MKSKRFHRYYLLSCIGVLIVSYYPLSMGVRVITDMIVNGTVLKENYPKYIILCTLTFLGLCILACFTAFWRDGSIQVSPLSAILMTTFFALLGITVGIFVGSFLLGKRKLFSVWIPAFVASVMTLLMYIGEMILLNGHLYRFGAGLIFKGIPGIVLAPIDLFVVVISGGITIGIFTLLNGGRISSKER